MKRRTWIDYDWNKNTSAPECLRILVVQVAIFVLLKNVTLLRSRLRYAKLVHFRHKILTVQYTKSLMLWYCSLRCTLKCLYFLIKLTAYMDWEYLLKHLITVIFAYFCRIFWIFKTAVSKFRVWIQLCIFAVNLGVCVWIFRKSENIRDVCKTMMWRTRSYRCGLGWSSLNLSEKLQSFI